MPTFIQKLLNPIGELHKLDLLVGADGEFFKHGGFLCLILNKSKRERKSSRGKFFFLINSREFDMLRSRAASLKLIGISARGNCILVNPGKGYVSPKSQIFVSLSFPRIDFRL